jgi:hypothetical protein
LKRRSIWHDSEDAQLGPGRHKEQRKHLEKKSKEKLENRKISPMS